MLASTLQTLGVLALFAVLLVSIPSSAQPAPDRADLALVLAVDVSGSVSDERFHLQRDGIAQGLEGLTEEITRETIEIAVVEWSSDAQVIVPWTVLRTANDIKAVAALLHTAPRSSSSLTDVGLGISVASDLMAARPLPADRQVIDVSGDGKQNTGDLAATRARDLAVAAGITVNGLPIVSGGEENLKEWYDGNVVGGDQAFLIVADGFDDFARAMRQKLTLEVASR